MIVPDVLLQPHNAFVALAFYDGRQFPAEYQGDIFSSQHGAWNKGVRTGYEVIRVPLHQSGQASGEYEISSRVLCFRMVGVWGRPVGVTVAADGSLLVTDYGSNSIWRVSCTASSSLLDSLTVITTVGRSENPPPCWRITIWRSL